MGRRGPASRLGDLALTECSTQGCGEREEGRGLCVRHYEEADPAERKRAGKARDRVNHHYRASQDLGFRRRRLEGWHHLERGWIDRTLETQGGRCANPGCLVELTWPPAPSLEARAKLSPTDMAIDHDHSCCPKHRSCGRCVRGILCRRCNSSAGHAGDDPARLRGLASYLEET